MICASFVAGNFAGFLVSIMIVAFIARRSNEWRSQLTFTSALAFLGHVLVVIIAIIPPAFLSMGYDHPDAQPYCSETIDGYMIGAYLLIIPAFVVLMVLDNRKRKP